MSTGTLLPVEHYLSTTFSPDVDYVEGEIVERNLGERDHSILQAAITGFFLALKKRYGCCVLVEQRLRVSASRYRIPDVCLTRTKPPGQILVDPPWIVVEILSKDDTINRMQERIDDYLSMGVEHIWVLDPVKRSAYDCTRAGWAITDKPEAKNPDVTLPLHELFADLD